MEYALEMPAAQFFVMLEAARELRNREAVMDCYKARASVVGKEGFEEILNFFGNLDKPTERPRDVEVPKPEPLKGEAARAAVMGVLSKDRRVGNRQREVH